jgi:carbamoyl-phosphate synthase large subunit
VLVTGGGSSATSSTIYSLKRNPEGRPVKVVCTDIRRGIAAEYMCDKFHLVPRATDPDFVDSIIELALNEGVDVIIPQVPAELPVFAANKSKIEKRGLKVAVSSLEAIETALNKYAMLRAAERLGVPVPKYKFVRTWNELVEAAEEVGYPAKPFVVRIGGKGDGMRGFRIIVPKEKAWEWMRSERPGGPPWITLSTLREALGDGEELAAPVLVEEYLPGTEYTVDVLAARGKVYVIVPRRRLEMRISMTFSGVVEKREDVIEYSRRLSLGLGLEYAFGFQFREDENGTPRLLECNPRIQSTMILSTFAGANIVWGAVKLALGEEPPPFHILWGTTLYRYWGAIGVYQGKVIGSDWIYHNMP